MRDITHPCKKKACGINNAGEYLVELISAMVDELSSMIPSKLISFARGIMKPIEIRSINLSVCHSIDVCM